MASNIRPLTFFPSRSPDNQEVGGELKNLRESTSTLIDSIITESGDIDFSVLLRFFHADSHLIQSYFEKDERIAHVFFPFLDFLKSAFFSENKTIPAHVMEVFRENPIIRDGIFEYIMQNNDQVMTLVHTEQENTISFHLLLLGGKDFNVRTDIETNHFIKISSLFADVCSRIYNELGIIKTWQGTKLPLILERELTGFMALSETINKLALVCAANLEAMQTSLRLGSIIRSNVNSLIKQLDTSTFDNNTIKQKLQFLSGKVQCNFAHGAPIRGSSIHEIQKQVMNIIRELELGFHLQEESHFGGDGKEYYSSMMICEGNRAIAELLGIQQVEKIQGFSTEELGAQKKIYLQTLYDVYNFGVNKNLSTGHEVISDFVQKDIEHEHQIEAVYYIALFDPSIDNETLLTLIDFFYPGRSLRKTRDMAGISHVNNFFYEEFIIKIITRIIRKLHTSPDKDIYLSFVDWIYTSLENKDVSHSMLSYSKVYLALALYYIDCSNGTEKAKETFIHYQNLTTRDISINKQLQLNADESYFYATLGKRDELERYGKNHVDKEALIKSGKIILKEVALRWKNDAMARIQEMISDITTTMNRSNEVHSQDYFNKQLGVIISQEIFYNLCTITIVGDQDAHQVNPNDETFLPSGSSLEIKTQASPIIPPRRGFLNTHINVDENMYIVFTYPMNSEKIFEQIFFHNKESIGKYFLHIFATNNKNILLQQANKSLHDNITELRKSEVAIKKLAYFDGSTGLPNKNKLLESIEGKRRIIILVEVMGHDMIVTGDSGEKKWDDIIKFTAKFIKDNNPGAEQVYRYSTNIVCLTYDPKAFTGTTFVNQTELRNMVYGMTDILLNSFYEDTSHTIQCQVGISLGRGGNTELQRALIALRKSKNKRGQTTHVFDIPDKKEIVDMEQNEQLLLQALNQSDEQVKLVPYYQRIFDPKNPAFQKYEALARIECLSLDGTKQVVYPDKFIEIAEKKRHLSKITMRMLPQILSDMKRFPNLRVSINIHEQDWNHGDIIQQLVFIAKKGEIDPRRITLEVLETASFDRASDIEKIRKLQTLEYQFSIDDYGTGTSNATKVIEVGPNNIKVDAKIIKKLTMKSKEDDSDDIKNDITRQKLAATMEIKELVFKSKALGFTVTAEYIDSQEVYDMVRSLGVDFFQGYYFAKALPLQEIMMEA